MRNIILAYVYNIITESEKEIFEALSLTESDKNLHTEDLSEHEESELQEVGLFNKPEGGEIT